MERKAVWRTQILNFTYTHTTQIDFTNITFLSLVSFVTLYIYHDDLADTVNDAALIRHGLEPMHLKMI